MHTTGEGCFPKGVQARPLASIQERSKRALKLWGDMMKIITPALKGLWCKSEGKSRQTLKRWGVYDLTPSFTFLVLLSLGSDAFSFFHCSYYFTLEQTSTFKHIPSDILSSFLHIDSYSSITKEQRLFLLQELHCHMIHALTEVLARNGSVLTKGFSRVLAVFCTGTMD